jgi:PBP1b-binding outer membrane lipoprotein LpoB
MKKVMNSIFAVAVTALIITGCKGKDGVADNPKAVLVAFFERMAKKDLEGAAKLATKDSKKHNGYDEKGCRYGRKHER